MSAERAHRERWREGLDEAEQEAIIAALRGRARAARARRLPLRPAPPPLLRADASRGRREPASDGEWPRPRASDLVFVGGTGRSGTHILGRLLGSHSALRRRPDRGALSLQQAGHAGPARGPGDAWAASSSKLRELLVAPRPGRRPAARPLQPDDAAGRSTPRPSASSAAYHATRWPPAGELFMDLLWPLADAEGKPGLVEMSSHNISQAQTLRRLFPEARFVHAVRDGRDAASSVTTKTWGPDSIVDGDRLVGRRLRAIEAGVRGEEDGAAYSLGPSSSHVVVLDDLVGGDREAAYAGLLDFLELEDDAAMREFFDRADEPGRSARGALARGPGAGSAAARVRRKYERTLAALARRGQPRRRARCSTPTSASGERDRMADAERILFVTSNGTGLGHLTRSMAIARRLDPALEPLFLTLSAAAPVVRELGFPVEYMASYATPGRGQRLALVAAAARAPARGDRRGRSRRCSSSTAPIPTRRCIDALRGRSRRPRGLVPAAVWQPGLEPGRADAQRVLRRGARAGRARRRARTAARPSRGATRPTWSAPIVFCDDDELLPRARGRARARARARARSTCWSSSARAPRWPTRPSGAWRAPRRARGRPGRRALLGDRAAPRRARGGRAPARDVSDQPLLRRLRRRGLGRGLQRVPRADPVRGAGALRADAAPDRRPGRARAVRGAGGRRAGGRRPGLATARGAARRSCSTPSGAPRCASACGELRPANGAADAARWLERAGDGRARAGRRGGGAGGAGGFAGPLRSARRAAPFVARAAASRRGLRQADAPMRRPPRTLVLALGIADGEPLERELDGRARPDPRSSRAGAGGHGLARVRRRCCARAWASSTCPAQARPGAARRRRLRVLPAPQAGADPCRAPAPSAGADGRRDRHSGLLTEIA